MSIVNSLLWGIGGLMLGTVLTISLAGSDLFRDRLLKRIFRSNKDGWALVQRGNTYTLDPLTRDSDQRAYRIGPEEEAEWKEDPADLMHSIYGIPLGLALEEKRPLVDAQTAAATEAAADMETDGGVIKDDDEFTVDELTEKLMIGKQIGRERTLVYCNPYIAKDRLPDLVDLRNITKAMRHDTGSDAPRKSAKNAVEAERDLKGGSGLKRSASLLAAAMVGGILVYIGGSGGGGGGGGVDIPIMLDAALGLL